jgi:copper transport protein
MPRIFLFIGLLLATMLSGRAAFAHAVLLTTTPENGAVLDAAPREITLRFNETVTPISLTIVGRNGQSSVPAAAITVRDEEVHAAIPDDLSSGSYIVSYRVVSADSHPVSGSLLFSIGAPSGVTPAAPDLHEQEDIWAFLVILNRILLLAGLLFSAGGALFIAGVLRHAETAVAPLRRPLRVGALIAVVCAIIAVGLQGGLLTAAEIDASLHPLALLSVGWHSTLGTSAALIAIGLLLLMGRFGRHPSRALIWLGTAGAFLATAALAASGHAATAPPRWLATPAMAAHGVVIAFWAGSLWPLLHLLRIRKTGAGQIILRFSRLAVGAVAILVVSGLTLATLQLDGDFVALFTTPYGQLLLLKLTLVALLLALATYNKFRLTPALTRGERGSVERLARAIRLEIAAVGLILTVTVLLGQSPPPRALDAVGTSTAHIGHGGHAGHGVTATGESKSVQAKGYTAVVSVTPGRTGSNTIEVSLQGPDGAPFVAVEASVEISLPEQGVEPFVESVIMTAPGRYRGTTQAFIRPGVWHLSLIVLINDFERVTFDLPVTIRN